MREPTYRQALSHAWNLVWHNKVLWIFGVCSVFLGQWGLADFFGQINLFLHNDYSLPRAVSGVGQVLGGLYYNSIPAVLLDFWLLFILALVAVGVVFVAVVSRGSLISSAALLYKNKKRVPLSRCWHEGVKNFWRLLSITVVNKLLQASLILSIGYVILGSEFSFSRIGTALAVIVCAAALILILALEAVAIYASGYTVIDRAWFGEAVKKGWQLFKEHVIVSLELGLLLAAMTLVLVVVVALGSVIVIMPSAVIWIIAAVGGWQVLAGVGLSLAYLLFIILLILAGGIFNAFTTSSWVYLFMKMHHEGISSRVYHHLKRWLRLA